MSLMSYRFIPAKDVVINPAFTLYWSRARSSSNPNSALRLSKQDPNSNSTLNQVESSSSSDNLVIRSGPSTSLIPGPYQGSISNNSLGSISKPDSKSNPVEQLANGDFSYLPNNSTYMASKQGLNFTRDILKGVPQAAHHWINEGPEFKTKNSFRCSMKKVVLATFFFLLLCFIILEKKTNMDGI